MVLPSLFIPRNSRRNRPNSRRKISKAVCMSRQACKPTSKRYRHSLCRTSHSCRCRRRNMRSKCRFAPVLSSNPHIFFRSSIAPPDTKPFRLRFHFHFRLYICRCLRCSRCSSLCMSNCPNTMNNLRDKRGYRAHIYRQALLQRQTPLDDNQAYRNGNLPFETSRLPPLQYRCMMNNYPVGNILSHC